MSSQPSSITQWGASKEHTAELNLFCDDYAIPEH